MKKLLLFMFALLTGVSGAWAGTPTEDAYPVEGKTYYLYAIQMDGSRSYMYNDNGTLKVSNGSKTDANNYKWTVSKSGDFYYIANVAGNKLCASNAGGYWRLSLNSNGQTFDLAGTVSDGACVSIKASSYWWVTPKASGAYPDANYYLSSFGTNVAYSPNYIFEEVLPAHSLTADAYYTIYCDNDSKQYLYDSGSALAVGSFSRNQNYAWICKKNGDYYNLKNVQTEKYMGWQNVQAGAYDFIIGSGDPASRGYQAKSVGMATIYGPNVKATNDGRFLVMKYDNTFSQSTITYEKGTTNFSADLRFTRVKVVTFNKPVAVDGGSSVSVITVLTDGSDSFTLPTQYKYTISGVAYDAIQAVEVITAAGTTNITVTVSDILENNKLYRIEQAWVSNRFYLYSNTSDGTHGNRLWKNGSASTTSLLTDGKYIWQAKSSSSNWQIYNPTSTRYIAKATTTSSDGNSVNALSATTADAAEPFTIESAVTCDYPPSDFNTMPYVALKSNTKTTWLNTYNSGNNFVGWHNAVHAGYYFRFIPVKTVTFSQAVAVDGGSAVSTIYVAKDGSDSFTLPYGYKYTFGGNDYYAEEAAAAIAAAGDDDISVTVAVPYVTSLGGLSNSKCYYINNVDTEYDRGDFCVDNDGTYVSSTANAATSTSRNTDEKKRFAIIEKDDAYYLWSVSENKFVSKPASLSGGAIATTLTNDPDNALSLAIHDSYSTYDNKWKFNWPETDWYLNMSSYQLQVWANGANLDAGTLFDIVEAEDFDATEALDRFNENSVTFILKYDGEEVGRTTQTVHRGPAVIPASLDNGFMTYTYVPETIVEGTTTVTITATWNGPFDIYDTYSTSNHFYTISHNYSERANNYIWTYDGSSAIVPQTVATDAFGDINNNRLFCFVGDPYNGLTIYNKGAGSSKTVYSAGQNNAVVLSSTNTTSFIPTLAINNPSVSSNPFYFALKAEGTSYWLNWNKSQLAGWTEADNGGTCWVLPEGKYYLNYLSSLNLVAPAGAVGTSDGITDEGVRTELIETKADLDADLFYLDTKTADEKVQFKTKLTGVKNGSTIALGEGYWRIVNADPRYVTEQSKMPAIYYNGTDNLQWSINGLTADYQVKNIFKFAGSGTSYTIFSPNAQKYIKTSTQSGQGKGTGELGANGATVTLTSKGSSRYSLQVSGDAYVIHANGHNGGKNAGGGLVQYWNESSGSDPSGWYLVKVSYINISLNAGPEGDANYYATLCLPFDVTLDAACAYTLTLNGAHDGLTLSEAIAEIPAGTPVVIRYTKNTIKAAIASSAETSAPLTSTALTGVYVDTAVAADTDVDGAEDYFLGAAGSPKTIGFYHWAGSSLKANRAYFDADKLSGGLVKGFALNWDALIDGIQTVDNGKLTMDNAAIYNIAGQKMSKLQKGLNIVNGKKVMVK